MANKKKKRGLVGVSSGLQNVSLREENIGKAHTNVGSIFKMEHLQNLAIWASQKASVPCLAALFGNRLSANAEAAGVSLDRSLFSCEKCETLLQPGDNCTVRIEKTIKRSRRRKKSHIPLQNNVVYTCHYCLHRNVMMGTVKGHVKKLLASRSGQNPNSEHLGTATNKEMPHTRKHNETLNYGHKPTSLVTCQSPTTPGSVLSIQKTKLDGLSNASNAGRNSTPADASKGTGGGASSKRRKRGWSSLKQMVESNEQEKKFNMSNLVIPLKL